MKILLSSILVLLILQIQACSLSNETQPEEQLVESPIQAKTIQSSQPYWVDPYVVWAANFGGSEHRAADGIVYLSDTLETTARMGQMDNVIGAQDAMVYQTYRAGDLSLSKALPNGQYDIVFKFSEPNESAKLPRVFNVVAEGDVVIPELNIKNARDGNAKSALDRTVLNVQVSDGSLDIEFHAITGEPLLNAIVVRAKQKTDMSEWNMVWGDEFDYHGAPDSSKWNFDVWPAGKVNHEEQAYTQRPKNVRVEDGKLVIQAHKEDYQKASYTSGRVHSAGKGDMLYGRLEIRAKLPAGQGTWPAIWMLPSNPFKYASTCEEGADWQGSSTCDAWPNSGEIDIMEHVGYDMNRVHGTVHTNSYYWVYGNQRKASVEALNAEQEFHVYALEWSPDRIDIFFDDTCYFTYLKTAEGWQAWPFDHPFHLIMNVAVGGAWGSAGGPTDASAFPATMEIDYVRLYERLELAVSE